MPSGERTRRRDADENLDRLLDAAAQVLGENPAAPMGDIAAASGLGRVTAWRHLGSREQLMRLLNERASAEIRAALEDAVGDGPPSPASVAGAVEALTAVGLRYRVLFVAQPATDLGATRRAALAPLIRAIRGGQRARTLRTGLAPELTAAFVAGLAEVVLQEAGGDAKALKRAVATAQRFAEAALQPDRSTP